MNGIVLDSTPYWLLSLWVIGVVVLGIVLIYGVSRAGRLRRSERARLDRDTVMTRRAEEASEPALPPVESRKKGFSYALAIPALLVCVAIVLMVWAMKGTNQAGARKPDGEDPADAKRATTGAPAAAHQSGGTGSGRARQ